MREKTIKVYKVSELEGRALDRAYHDWLGSSDYPWSGDNEATLKAFEEIFPVDIKNWEYDTTSYHVQFDLICEEEVAELKGVRLMKYMANNYFEYVFKGKYYSLWSKKDVNPHYKPNGHAPKGKLKSKHSKELYEFTCSLTGYYIDMDILQPIHDCIKGLYIDTGYTFEDIMQECLDNWGKACRDDFEGYTSMESFIEHSDMNDWEYDESGRII